MLTAAIERLAEGDFHQLPVFDAGVPVGFLSRAGVVQHLQWRNQLDAVRKASSQRSSGRRGTGADSVTALSDSPRDAAPGAANTAR
jgi:hypothetical protein